jgi:hypothetical protein
LGSSAGNDCFAARAITGDFENIVLRGKLPDLLSFKSSGTGVFSITVYAEKLK